MKLNIKEACRYQNFLDSVINTLSSYIRDTDNAIKITEIHLKSKNNSDAKDEILDKTTERQFDCSVVDIAYLINNLIGEKCKLSNAIEHAKRGIVINVDNQEFTLDSALENAKRCRALSGNIKVLTNLKSRGSKKSGSDYKFNVEGNQVRYVYDVEVVTTIDYDRNNIIKLYKKLVDKADKLSNKIELAMLQDVVDYEMIYDLHDSVEEIVEKYLVNNK
jgi:hypothetical protein